MYGVFADQEFDTLWACFSSIPGRHDSPQAPSALKAFDLRNLSRSAIRYRCSHESVYSIAPKGLSLLVEMEELNAGRGVHEQGEGQLVANLWLDINEVHLALRRRNVLVRWTPESEIRSQERPDNFRVREGLRRDCHGHVRRRGLSLCTGVRAIGQNKEPYVQICRKLDEEVHINTLLYLTPMYHALSCMKQCFAHGS